MGKVMVMALIEDKLIKSLTIDKVLEVLDHADNYQAEKLKYACMRFTFRHRNKIVHTEGFDKIIVQ